MTETVQADVTGLAVTLLSAYVSNNTVPASDLAALIESTKKALVGEVTPAEPAPQEFAPATTVRKSLASREHIISMIDGKPYKTLKRHLATHGLTPAEYRARYNLAHDYPLVAPAYSEARREVAKVLGLGRKPGTKVNVVAAPAAEAAPAAAEVAIAKPVRAKPKAAASAVTAATSVATPVKAAAKAKTVVPKAKAPAPKAEVAEPKANAVAAEAVVTPKPAAKAKATAKPAQAASAKKATAAKGESNGAAQPSKPRKKLSIVVPQAEAAAPKAA